MTTLEDIALASCLKSNIPVPAEYVQNGISYDDFTRMLMKHIRLQWRRIIYVINRSKILMVRQAINEDWSNAKWRAEVENLKHDCLRDYFDVGSQQV